MKPILKGLSSIDLPDGASLPPDPADCWVVVTASIGLAGDDASDNFTFYVCTVRRLERVVADEAQLWGRHLLITNEFDWDAVRSAIQRICDSVSGETWESIATEVGRYAGWEFEDYRPAR